MKRAIVFTMLSALMCFAQTGRPQQLVAVQKVPLIAEEDIRRYTGRLVSPSTVLTVPRVSGEILEVGFKDGARVKKGQMLYTLDPVQYYAALKACEAQVAACKANISQAKAKIAECQARLTYAKNNFDRNLALFEKNVVTRDTYESIKSEMDSENAAMKAAEANMEVAKASLLEAEANLIKAKDNHKNTIITAPMDAVAGVTNKTVGNYVTPSTGTLVTLIQTNPMRARFSISIHEYLTFLNNNGEISGDPTITMILADGTEYKHNGVLELINNETNKNTDTIQIFARFPNENGVLTHGSTVAMHLHFRSPKKKTAVYPSCIMHDAKSAYVYVVDETGKVGRRDVSLGLATSDWQFINSGLKEGEIVIKDGMHKTMPGDTVKTTEEDTVNRE